jgi:hypothetical protein
MSLEPVLEAKPQYGTILQRMCEPERLIMFRCVCGVTHSVWRGGWAFGQGADGGEPSPSMAQSYSACASLSASSC